MRSYSGFKKKSLTNKYLLLANGEDKSLGDFVGSVSYNSSTKKLQYTPIGGTASDIITFGDRAFDSTSYLPLSGGTMTGPLKWKNGTALPERSSVEYVLSIDAFDNGGKTYWSSMATLKSSLGLGSNAYTSTAYLPLTGGTLTNKDSILNINSNDANGYINFKVSNVNKGYVGYHSTAGMFLQCDSYYIHIPTSGDLKFYDGSSDRTVYHSGNLTPGNYFLKAGDTIGSGGFIKWESDLKIDVYLGRLTVVSHNGAVALGLNLGSLLISSAWADYTKVPTNGIWCKGQIISGVANGTAPLQITSSTLVSNLNADLLDGKHASAFATSGHTHSYLPLSGGTLTGRISRDSGGSWISARDNVIVYTTRTSGEGSDWHPVVGGKTSSGFWSLGSVGGESLIFSYDTDSDYNAGRNNNTRLNIPVTNGTLATESYVTSRGYITSSGSCNYATSSSRLYASDSPYRYGDSAPYYAYITYNTNSDNRWYLRMTPATPATIAVDYAYNAGYASRAGYIAGDLCMNNGSNEGNYGISLYRSGFVYCYGIIFTTTSNYGTHNYTGGVSGDWATYFTMSADSGRGWVFKTSGVGNVASISNNGHLTLTSNGVTCVIGSLNSSWVHFENNSGVLYYFDHSVLADGHFYEYSDLRLKNIISGIKYRLEDFAKIPLVAFEWKKTPGEINLGTIALNVQAIIPEIVSEKEYLSLDYGILGTISGVTACKEIMKLKKEVADLKNKLSLLTK